MHIAVAWPKPRRAWWLNGRARPEEFPDLSDALLFLEAEGWKVTLEDSCGLPLNPFAGSHHFYSGFDPVRAARIALRAGRYDAAVCVGDSTALVLTWLKSRFGLRLPLVLVDPALGDGYPRRKRLQDYVLPRTDQVVVYGRAQIQYLQQEYGPRVTATWLPHRADVDFYRPDADKFTAPRRPFVFSIGNDISRDFATFARAAGRCRATAVVGADYIVQTSTDFADPEGRVEVRREHISYARLREMYAQAAVVVVPLRDTRHAGGINALLEAMAMEKAVVVSASIGLDDYVTDGATALVVPPGDDARMAEAIDRLLRSPTLRAELGRQARAFVVEHCDNAKYARRLADVIRSVVET